MAHSLPVWRPSSGDCVDCVQEVCGVEVGKDVVDALHKIVLQRIERQSGIARLVVVLVAIHAIEHAC